MTWQFFYTEKFNHILLNQNNIIIEFSTTDRRDRVNWCAHVRLNSPIGHWQVPLTQSVQFF